MTIPVWKIRWSIWRKKTPPPTVASKTYIISYSPFARLTRTCLRPPPTPSRPSPGQVPPHLSITQANVAVCRARHMAAFLHKEAARMVADRQHAFDLAKKGHAKELSRLREENRSLLQQLPQSSTQEVNTTPHSLTYSGKLCSLTAQNEALQKRLKAATVNNTSLTDKLQQTRSSTTQASTQLHAQVASLNQVMSDMKRHYQWEIEVMSSDKDKSLMEQRAEIETLHAEHDHAMAVMQAESKAHTDTITLLQHELATTKAQAILPSVAQGLRKDISAQFHTITALNTELAATKDEAIDLMEALTQAKTAHTVSEQTSTNLKADIQSLTDQLETSQHNWQDAQNQTQALQAQIQQLMLPPPPIQMPSQVVDVPSATTPSQVQSLREELTSLSLQASTRLAPLPPQSQDDQVFCPTPTPVSSPTTEEPYMGSWAETADREAHLPPREIPPTDQLPLPPPSPETEPARATTTQEVTPLHQNIPSTTSETGAQRSPSPTLSTSSLEPVPPVKVDKQAADKTVGLFHRGLHVQVCQLFRYHLRWSNQPEVPPTHRGSGLGT